MTAHTKIGSIVTFYSWKGGVGRTMALANVGVQLSRRGHRVLLVDWDMEAPGLDRYFIKGEAATFLRVVRPKDPSGLIGLLRDANDKASAAPSADAWKKRLFHIYVPEASNTPSPASSQANTVLHLMGSGLGCENYGRQVSDFSWSSFFADSRGGEWLEGLRNQWREEYDFVLVDSRTGLTDSGGVCTVQMPDILILVITSNEQSLGDGLRLIKSMQANRRDFAYDRAPLAVVPLLSRWDGDDEVDLGVKWLERMDMDLRQFTSAWLPKEFTPRQFLEKVRIPHVARFSFGEPLPVITHSLTDASLPGMAYENLASLLDSRLLAAGTIIDPTYSPTRYAAKYDATAKFDSVYEVARASATGLQSVQFFADVGLNSKFSFDSFVVGTNCIHSTAVAKAVAQMPGRIFNPLFFYGQTGLGKTHLMQAIGQEVLIRKKHSTVRYVTSEQFANEYLEAVKKQTLSQFRQKYRKADLLLVDDVQFFADKDNVQEEFFHTFNELFNRQKQIVLVSDRPPGDIKNLEDRLVTRFESGLISQIQIPDFETRVAILRRKMHDFNVGLDPWIIEFIAQRIRTNIRRLEGALMRVAAHVSLEGNISSETSLAQLLHDVIDEPQNSVTVERVQRDVANEYDLRISDLTGPSRVKKIVEARQLAMYLTRYVMKLPLMQIGDEFGGRNYGTVIHACNFISDRVSQSDDFRRMVERLEAKLLES